MSENKTNENLNYMKILILLFVVNFLIAIGGTILNNYLGDGYVFHSWLSALHIFSWILTVGLVFIIPLAYCTNYLSILILPVILLALTFGFGIDYKEEIRSGPYVIQEVQALGEKMVFYYTDVNIFIMKKSHEEIIR